MRNRIAVFFLASVVAVLAALPASAQDQPVTQTWSFQTTGVGLPGGKAISGVDGGVTFTPSANLDLFERNLISTDHSLGYYAGGVTYRFPAISTKANNAAQNVNFLRVRFGLKGSFGVARVNGVNHYGFTAGPTVDYSLTKTGSWTFGGSVEYAHFPQYAGKAIVELGPTFHF